MSGINVELTGKFRSTNPGNVDWFYGGGNEAYPDLATALDPVLGVPEALRAGRTVGIYESGSIVEYWWNTADLTSSGLVRKNISDGGSITSNMLGPETGNYAELFKVTTPNTTNKFGLRVSISEEDGEDFDLFIKAEKIANTDALGYSNIRFYAIGYDQAPTHFYYANFDKNSGEVIVYVRKTTATNGGVFTVLSTFVEGAGVAVEILNNDTGIPSTGNSLVDLKIVGLDDSSHVVLESNDITLISDLVTSSQLSAVDYTTEINDYETRISNIENRAIGSVTDELQNSINGKVAINDLDTNAGEVLGAVPTLDAGGKIKLSQIPTSVTGGLNIVGFFDTSGNRTSDGTPLNTVDTNTLVNGEAYQAQGAVVINFGANGGSLSFNAKDIAVWDNTNDTWFRINSSDDVESVNGQTGIVVLNPDDLDDSSSDHKFLTNAEKVQLGTTTSQVSTNTQDISDIKNEAAGSVTKSLRDAINAIQPGGSQFIENDIFVQQAGGVGSKVGNLTQTAADANTPRYQAGVDTVEGIISDILDAEVFPTAVPPSINILENNVPSTVLVGSIVDPFVRVSYDAGDAGTITNFDVIQDIGGARTVIRDNQGSEGAATNRDEIWDFDQLPIQLGKVPIVYRLEEITYAGGPDIVSNKGNNQSHAYSNAGSISDDDVSITPFVYYYHYSGDTEYTTGGEIVANFTSRTIGSASSLTFTTNVVSGGAASYDQIWIPNEVVASNRDSITSVIDLTQSNTNVTSDFTSNTSNVSVDFNGVSVAGTLYTRTNATSPTKQLDLQVNLG